MGVIYSAEVKEAKSGVQIRSTLRTGRPCVDSSATIQVSLRVRAERASHDRSYLSDPFSSKLTDVAGVAWSPNDEYVASVGLDSSAYVYSGKTFGKPLRLWARQRCLNLALS